MRLAAPVSVVPAGGRAAFNIRGERYGRAWKRRFRHAQLHLKRKGVLSYDPGAKVWMLAKREPDSG